MQSKGRALNLSANLLPIYQKVTLWHRTKQADKQAEQTLVWKKDNKKHGNETFPKTSKLNQFMNVSLHTAEVEEHISAAWRQASGGGFQEL